ncbi:hypothetical protein [Metallosphaera javensis (ex Sakai et al. 2022)]|uniref:hypothetical protein n=1 Tax=Metallosphaera javensis (ex Sakai et al. 2022) TaxID=2775498 RepID=UPI00258ABB6E|nr:MAG: hypothetical protein MjAS7_1623 [Metallosphaera javensis (ex Sakai et al. 2022)]
MSYHDLNSDTNRVSTQEELIRIVFDPLFPTLAHKPVEEVEELAMREVKEVSPRYDRGKKLKRRRYARYRFLKVSRW